MRKKNLLSRMLLLLAAMVAGVGTAWAADETIKFSELSLTNGTQYTSFTGSANNVNFDLAFGDGSNDGKYYNTGAAIRVYGEGHMTVSSTKTIVKIELTFGSGDGSNTITTDVDTYSNGTWEGSASSVTFTIGGKSGHRRIASVSVTYESSSSTPTCATPTFSPAAGTYTSAQNVVITTATEGATIYYTLDGTDPTTSSSVYSSAINVSTTTTIKAMAVMENYDNSLVASAVYNFVTLDHAGTEADPYSVSDARIAIDNNVGVSDVYAKGIVSEIVTAYNFQYGNITYNISTDGSTTADQLEAYRGKSYNGDNFTSEDDIQVGDEVVVYGSLTKYGDTYEFASGNQLVSLTRKPTATITVTNGTEQTVDRTQNEEELTLTATANSGATVVFTLDSDNTTLTLDTDFGFDNGYLAFYTAKGGTIVVKANAAETSEYKAAEEVTITITVIGEKEVPTIVVNSAETVAFGSTFTIDDGMIEGGAITVTSSNTAVATVSGLVITPVAVGTSTITVATAEDETYKAGSETFTLTVTAPEGTSTAYAATATTATLDFTSNTSWGLPTDATTGTNTYTADGYTITLNATSNGYKYSTNCLLMGKKGTYLSLPAFDKAVTQIDVVGTSGASTNVVQNIYVGETAVSTETTGAQNVTNKYVIASDYQAAGTIYTLKVTSNHNTQISSITIHFAATPLTVSLNASGYATYCSQYPLDFSDYETADYSAWQITEVSASGVITFSQITGSIKGGEGILLKGEADATLTLNSVASANTLSDNLLEGTLAPTYVDANEYYGLSGNTFVKIKAGTVPAGKAILDADFVPSSARLTFVFADETTGIATVKNVTEDSSVYNLNGQRISAPSKGLYIKNGKKVFINK